MKKLTGRRGRVVAGAALGVAVLPLLGVAAHLAIQGDAGADLAAAGSGQLLPQTIPVPAESEWVYGDSVRFAADPESSGNLVEVTSQTPEVCQVDALHPDRLVLVKVGKCSFIATQAGNADFAAATRAAGIGVEPRPLVVSTEDRAEMYSRSHGPWPVELEGLLPQDSDGVVARPDTSYFARSTPPGKYPITISGGNVTNYRLIYRQATLTVDPMLSFLRLPWPATPGLTVDGQHPDNQSSAQVPLGASGSSYQFAEVVNAGGELYITTDTLPATINENHRIVYSTIPELIAATSYAPAVKEDLSSAWDTYKSAFTEQDATAMGFAWSGIVAEIGANSGVSEVDGTGPVGVLMKHLNVLKGA